VAFFHFVKTPEPPRAYPAPLVDSPAVERREEKIIPRYIQAPALREHGLGPRNLFWGVVTLFLAMLLLVVAIFLSGATAMLSVVTCLLTFTALFVLARLHVFRQRNGGFLALALVCLIGTAMPLIERAYSAAKTFVATRSFVAEPVVALHPSETEAPLLTQSFALSNPEGDGKQVNVLRDSHVVIAGKSFLIRAGDRFPFVAAKGDETTFAVRDLRVSLPSNVVEVLDPTALSKGVSGGPVGAKATANSTAATDDKLAEITRNAQQEAMRRYPALAVKDSMENADFVSTYKQLKDAGSNEFFGNPEWPLELAELLAKREGWVRGGTPMTTGPAPAPVLDPPTADAPAPAGDAPAPTNLPIDSLDAGAGLPRSNQGGR